MPKHDLNAYSKDQRIHPSLQSQSALKEAFVWFQEASEHLADSYAQLEARVADLSGELAELSEQRMLELAEKEQLADQLGHLLNLLPAGVVLLDSNGVIARVNQAAVNMLSVSTEVTEPLEGQVWRDLIRISFKQDGADGHEVTLIDGRKIGIALTALEKEPGQIILMTDLTETRRLQAKVSQGERLSAMGRMATSLAHQIRTPLSAALLYSENITKRTLTGLQYRQFAQKISNRLRNIEQQIKDMMLFAKGEIQLNQISNLKTLVNKIQLHSEVVLKQSGIHLKVQLPKFMENYCIRCHEASLLGAIQNLINNAVDVTLPEIENNAQERAYLESDNEGVNESILEDKIHLRISSEHLGYAKLEIIDNGPGLPTDELSQLMEPFYSTKPKGTGLGLAVVSAVVRAHNGQFTLHNRTHAQGAIAELILPVIPETRLTV